MGGYIYIASAFDTVNRSGCGQGNSWVDNDPHFWTDPPTWGICRNDVRATAQEDDVIFFVLPIRGRHPQMIFAYLTIERIIPHLRAYYAPRLLSKRMGPKVPNGNIIVDGAGRYNRYDLGVHRYKWQKIARHYAIGVQESSRMLTATQIRSKAPSFLTTLGSTLGKQGVRAIDIISRKGARLTDAQVASLLAWLNAP